MASGVRWTEAQVAEVLARMAGKAAPRQSAKDAPESKYGAIRTEYRGRLFDSKAEARAAAGLDLRVAAGEILRWEPQAVVEIFWPGTETRVLRARLDFRLFWPDGRVSYLEVKGYRVRDWPLRERILRAAGVSLEVVGGKRRKRGDPVSGRKSRRP